MGSAGRLSSSVASPNGRQQSLDMLAARTVEATQGLACCSLEVTSWRDMIAARGSYNLVLERRLATPKAIEIFDQDVNDVLFVAARLARGMWRNKDVRQIPQRR